MRLTFSTTFPARPALHYTDLSFQSPKFQEEYATHTISCLVRVQHFARRVGCIDIDRDGLARLRDQRQGRSKGKSGQGKKWCALHIPPEIWGFGMTDQCNAARRAGVSLGTPK